MHPGEPSASAASTFKSLTDAELAAAFAARAKELRSRSGTFIEQIRRDEPMKAILMEFQRRNAAFLAARHRYRERHLKLVHS